MRIIRYNTPVFSAASRFTNLGDELDRLFDSAFPALGASPRGATAEFPIDLYRHKDSFVARAELPGFRKEDLSVEVEDGVLTITGHRKVEAPTDGEKEEPAATQERRVTRSIALPEQVKVDAIQAKYENGVLTVTLPKQEETKPRQITIDVK